MRPVLDVSRVSPRDATDEAIDATGKVRGKRGKLRPPLCGRRPDPDDSDLESRRFVELFDEARTLQTPGFAHQSLHPVPIDGSSIALCHDKGRQWSGGPILEAT